MKKVFITMAMAVVLILAACGGTEEETESEDEESQESEETTESEQEEEEKGEIVFGQTSWTSTAPPTQIAKQMLEEVGYDVEITQLDQPVIWEGMVTEEIDFFMDAWLPYTEEALWAEYEDDLQQVSMSYEEAPLGWVVPEYVEEESIHDLAGKGEKFDGEVVTIGEGAGIVELSKQVFEDENYDLEGFELSPSSEGAMITVMEDKISREEPFVITGWRPHSMFSRNDLKFLEDPNGHFKLDNVYVLSYNGIEEKHPEAYEILSQWNIDVDELESMIAAYENNDVSFEESAAQWIEDNRDTVDEWIGE